VADLATDPYVGYNLILNKTLRSSSFTSTYCYLGVFTLSGLFDNEQNVDSDSNSKPNPLMPDSDGHSPSEFNDPDYPPISTEKAPESDVLFEKPLLPEPHWSELEEGQQLEEVDQLADSSPPRHIYKVSPAEPPDWSDYTLPPLDDPVHEEDTTSHWKTAWSILREVGETIILTLIIFFLIQMVIRNFRVVGTSMVDNLHNGQYLIIDKVSYNPFLMEYLGFGGPKRGDVIVFEPPNRPGEDYVKRVIGLPGETVEIVKGRVFIDGHPLAEPFEPNTGSYNMSSRQIPEGEIFVLGDNRNNSNDSHNWGSLPIENIVGRAWLSYWPPEMWGTIPRDVPTRQATLKYFLLHTVASEANAESE